jgi:type I restriction enzyme S subunit
VSFPAYPSYQDTGVTWLGVRPSHWSLSRFKQVFQERDERSVDGLEELLSVSAYTGVSPRRGIIDDGDHLSRADSLEGYKKCFPDDLVMNIMLAWSRGLGFTRYKGIVSPAYCVFKVTDNSNPIYLDYLIRSDETILYFKGFSAGVIDSRLRLYPDAFLSLSCALPPPGEQVAIAAFLDLQTARIDALIEEQQRLIELLKEKRQAVISRAVTKGLDPTAPMKDSGVEWLGEVPAHWEVTALKRFVTSLDGRRIPLSAEERGHRAGPYPYYGASGVIDFVDDFIFSEELVLVSEDGANLLNRSTPIAFVATGSYWVNNHAHILRPCDEHIDFWSECIEVIDLAPFVTGSAQPKLTAEALGNLVVAVPPTSEERGQIAAAITAARQAHRPLIDEAEAAVSLLYERRSALISAAVTGKIDVRSVHKPKPEFESSSYADL